MTADAPNDYLYEVAIPSDGAEERRGYWDIAMGLQEVDGLKPSAYLKRLADDHVQGVRSLDGTREMLHAYYRERKEGAVGQGATEASLEASEEADMVSQRIVEVLSQGPAAFALLPDSLSGIHRRLFCDLDAEVYHPGGYKTELLVKREVVLNGDSVLYADPSIVRNSLDYLFREERAAMYAPLFDQAQLARFARFIALLWQVHPFVEGNTRTVAVFAQLYLRYLGFDIGNEPFQTHSAYFRDALVRANYRNAKAGVMPDLSYLEQFFDSLLNGVAHEFRSRDLMVKSLYDDPSLLRNMPPLQN